jgi:hypothetical protein
VGLFVLLILATAVACSAGEADEAEPGGRIVFLRSGDVLAEELGSNKTDVVARNVRAPSLSADGSALLFARGRMWWLRRDGSKERQVVVEPDDDGLVLSPDGSEIYFTRWLRADDGYAIAIFAMRTDGTNVRQVTRPRIWEEGTCDRDATPLADGGLAYTRYADCRRGADRSIELLGPDGAPVEVLRRFDERGDFWLTQPAVSADRRWISFHAENIALGPGTGLYVAAADGTEAHRIGAGGAAAWSPDGQWLAFADAGDLWIVRRDGSDRRRLTATHAREAVVTWLAGAP